MPQQGCAWPTLLPLILTALACSSTHARTWSIYADGSGDVPTIQEAIGLAASGDTILVGPGEYRGCLWIESKNIVLHSTAGPRSTVLRGAGAHSDPVVHFFFEASIGSTIEGFTVRNGTTGVACTSASPTIRGNIITDNHSALGAGICCIWESAARILDNVIADNEARHDCCFPSRGGGIYADESSAAMIRGNLIANNRCIEQCDGGGISAFIAQIENNTIYGNRSDGPGGGIELPFDGASVSNNIVVGNRSASFGDGIAVFRTADLACNDVWGNGDQDYSGTDPGLWDFSADPRFCGDPVQPSIMRGYVAPETYNLRADSPCLPGQHPAGADCGLIGARPAGCPITSPSPRRERMTAPTVEVFPNPAFGQTMMVRYRTPTAAPDITTAEVHDAAGRLVARLKPSAPGLCRWDGRTDDGHPVSRGIYFVRVRSGSSVQTGTILVAR